jgi:hypothetical protein
MIIGIVVIIIFALIFFMTRGTSEDTIDSENMQSAELKAELAPITTYLKGCLRREAVSGLFLLGKQGGYIYRNQGGTNDPILSVTYESHAVPYLIQQSNGGSGVCKGLLPAYPINNEHYPYTEATKAGIPQYAQQNCFGRVTEISSTGMAEDLAAYIEGRWSCTLDKFPAFDISLDNPKVEVSYSPTQTTVLLKTPAMVKKKQGTSETALKDVSVTIKLGLASLAEFTNDLMQTDSNDPLFDVGTATGIYTSSILRDVESGIDLIQVTAPAVKLDGELFTLRVARKNRPPALEYVSFNELATKEAGERVLYSDLFVSGSGPQAVDPDEDSLVFTAELGSGMRISSDETTPYVLQASDFHRSNLLLTVEVTDGEYTDYQEVAP